MHAQLVASQELPLVTATNKQAISSYYYQQPAQNALDKVTSSVAGSISYYMYITGLVRVVLVLPSSHSDWIQDVVSIALLYWILKDFSLIIFSLCSQFRTLSFSLNLIQRKSLYKHFRNSKKFLTNTYVDELEIIQTRQDIDNYSHRKLQAKLLNDITTNHSEPQFQEWKLMKAEDACSMMSS